MSDHPLSSSPTTTTVADLRCRPGDQGYADAAAWNLRIPSGPAAVVPIRTAAEVSEAVRYAADHGLKVAVRSTGHGAVPSTTLRS